MNPSPWQPPRPSRPPRPPAEEEWLDINDVVAIFRLRKRWIYRKTAKGCTDPMPHYKLGRELRFRRSEVTAWIERYRVSRLDDPAA